MEIWSTMVARRSRVHASMPRFGVHNGLVGLLVVILIIRALIVNGTGFDATTTVTVSQVTATSPTTVTTIKQYQPGKTLWDWLQLLIIPIMLAVGGFWLNQFQKTREERAAEQRAKIDREAAEQRIQADRMAAEQRADADRKAAEQRARADRESAEMRSRLEHDLAHYHHLEAALQDYLDRISELLLERDLRRAGPEEEVCKVARVRTLTALTILGLNSEYKTTVLRFLYEAGLIDKDKPIISLAGADLSGVGPSEFRLLNDTPPPLDLCEANLGRCNLRVAHFRGANLTGTDFSEADFTEANLSEGNLSGANLSRADLTRANLSGANLSGANLKGTIGITIGELEKQAKSLKGAIMPNGEEHL